MYLIYMETPKEKSLQMVAKMNVFDIQQGVSIILGVKTGGKQAELADVYHAELFGARKAKFDDLNDDAPNFNKIDVTAPGYYFLRKDTRPQSEYDQFIGIRDLMPLSSSAMYKQRRFYYSLTPIDAKYLHVYRSL